MRRTSIVLVLALGLFLTACSAQEPEVVLNEQVPAAQAVAEVAEGEEGEPAVEADFAAAEAVWVAEQLAFTSAPSSMPADEVVMGLQVIGGLPHNVIFEGLEGDRVLVDGPGEGEFAAVNTIPAGTYTYYCGIPGHRAAGMEGEITVG
ncbi:hypothetical protein DVS28_a0909 [Euzebya pacifica]|jgi:nitrite reductase (NO-forming)|uniref:Blue (type 1) copper domain-containing protein n=1 Tax=Euzebya pacifica TaxID=1608957 RepID=A0A346XTR3_9ACTN|nr:plastocyanin/azurin family copper-binding protein [Euzebya pacifica]AXV05610.1 hypothetical protein DVS28_a0909 [Euzebya pacifica]